MRNQNIFCSRKSGATIKGKFFAYPPYSELKSQELNRKFANQDKKRLKRLM